ncbi:hypothetical protein GN156_01910 [bacterium LRH843]|nr:hypothetical protein [bacterium LRH843]
MKNLILWWAACIGLFIFLIFSTAFVINDHHYSKEDVGLKAVQGHFDLQNKVMVHDGPFKLDGEWEFYWRELLTPEDMRQTLPNQPPYMAVVPNFWNHYIVSGEALPKYGYATYRLTLLLNEGEIGQLVSLYIPNVATAYRLYVDEKLLASNGVVGESRQQMTPENYSKTITFEAESQQIELLFQVSNFHQPKAGLWESITFGTDEQVTYLRERNIFSQAFVIGCILIIGFYHIMMYFQRPRDLSPLFLGLACLGRGIRTLLIKDILLIHLIPQIRWEMEYGGDDYLTKPFDPNVLVARINALLRRTKNKGFAPTQKLITQYEQLTVQERQILQWIEKGYTNKEIAIKLALKEGTIKVYNHIIFQKLQVKNRTQAIVRAKEEKLI